MGSSRVTQSAGSFSVVLPAPAPITSSFECVFDVVMVAAYPRWTGSHLRRARGGGVPSGARRHEPAQRHLGDAARNGCLLGPRGLEEAPPGRDVRAGLEHRPALALGHAAPHAPLELVVQ